MRIQFDSGKFSTGHKWKVITNADNVIVKSFSRVKDAVFYRVAGLISNEWNAYVPVSLVRRDFKRYEKHTPLNYQHIASLSNEDLVRVYENQILPEKES
jgi:hypothetical protein